MAAGCIEVCESTVHEASVPTDILLIHALADHSPSAVLYGILQNLAMKYVLFSSDPDLFRCGVVHYPAPDIPLGRHVSSKLRQRVVRRCGDNWWHVCKRRSSRRCRGCRCPV